MRRRPRLAAAFTILLLAGCGAPGAGAAARPLTAEVPARPAGYHGVVVRAGAGGATDTTWVRFATDWRREVSGRDTVWAFPRGPAGGGWDAFGQVSADSLRWSLGRLTGDAGVVRGFVGAAGPDGTVRGCAVPPRGGRWTGRVPEEYGAFALRPLDAPRPAAADAPLSACAPAAR